MIILKTTSYLLDDGCMRQFSYYMVANSDYYLCSYLGVGISGTISTSINGSCHIHSYSVTQNNVDTHYKTCSCGFYFEAPHHFDDHYCLDCNQYTSTHDYDRNYSWYNYKWHNVQCSCGASKKTPHVIAPGPYNGDYALCIECGGDAFVGFTPEH